MPTAGAAAEPELDGSLEPSHVLAAIGAIGSDEQAALRLSLGRTSDAATVDYAIGAVVDVVNTLRSVA